MAAPVVAADSDAQLNDEEFALYDRQIRLWGLDAQKRITTSSVLFIGLNGLVAEAAKNLALAGVRGICVCEDRLSSTDMDSEIAEYILLPQSTDSITRRVARYFQQLNPRVIFELTEQMPSDLRRFDVLCLCVRSNIDSVNEMNKMCRDEGVKFIYAFAAGQNGILFNDLLEYEYSVEKAQVQDGNDNNPSSRSSIDRPIEYERRLCQYVDYNRCISFDWRRLSSKRLKRMSKSTVLFLCTSSYERDQNLSPCRDKIDSLLEYCQRTLPKELAVTKEDLEDWFTTDYFPVCAVLGGVLSQEITKIASRMGQPIENLFTFDCRTGRGCVMKLGM